CRGLLQEHRSVPGREARRGGGRAPASRRICQPARRRTRDGATLPADPPGHGDAERPARRGGLSARLHRGDEGERLHCRRAQAQQSTRRASGACRRIKTQMTVSADAMKDLAPTGKLRASINLGNIVLAQGTPDAPSGVTPELARELARRLGVACELKCFDAAGKAFNALKAGEVDIVFLAIEP